MTQPAVLIGLDWGSTHLRAARMGAHGEPLETRQAPHGVLHVTDGRFEDALDALCGDWLAAPAVPVLAAGMVGSRQGWVEAPYVACPAAPAAAAQALTTVALRGGGTLRIVPGLRCVGPDGQLDVLRGEETQIWGERGEDDGGAERVVVLPGTHSKWAWIGAGDEVRRFQTYMTGELYALLVQHGILGRLMAHGHDEPAAFADGVHLGLAEHAHVPHLLFAARTAGLSGERAPEALPDFLSGLLIGAELGSVCARGPRPGAVSVVGEAALVERYERALALAGFGLRPGRGDAVWRGLWRIASAGQLLPDPTGGTPR